ncbi:unnamed protein product [Rotaria sp. Silwood1]|nr:unnamed protein product [Rotaria sp. Silwood1]CAF4703641.1 unnamed protein product [Rotaria sp. Silwood1]
MEMTNTVDPTQSTSVIFVVDASAHKESEKSNLDFGTDIEEDETLALKMRCVNNAINEIGFTSYQLKLFFLNGFGYAVDSLLILLNALTQPQVALQYKPPISKAQTMALGVGLLFGALFWGAGADGIGGASPNYIAVCVFIALLAFGGGGNLILDTAVYLEFLPGKYQWSLTFMAAWWGVGQMVAGLVAWPFLANYSCTKDDICTNANNSGWRYTFYTLGSFVFVLSFLRLFVIRLKESPKWLLSQNRDAELVKIIHEIAHAAGKECSLTLEQLESIGPVVQNNNLKKYNPMIIWHHIKGLFPNRKMGYSTALNIASWTLIGLAYPLYNVFLPYYLQSRGDSFGDGSVYTTYRNYAIVNVCSVFGPIIAGGLVEVRFLGRRYTMVIGALLTMTFLFAFTAVRTAAQNLAFTVSISVCLNIYYSTLYAYTPEVLPSAHRGTGNAITVACNRVMGIVAALVGTYADLSSSVPIYVCAAAFGGLALLSFLFPFEPQGRTSS